MCGAVSVDISSAGVSLQAMQREVSPAILLCVLLLALSGCARDESGDSAAPIKAPPLADYGGIGGDFTLVDQRGDRFDLSSLRGRPAVLFFGYTYCPDVCPTELQTIAVALDELGGKAAEVQPLFITIDPARHTPEILADYVAAFHPRLLGLSGSGEAVRAAAHAYRVFFAKGTADEDGDYLMDHSSFVDLIGPDGQYRANVGPTTAPEAMAEKIEELL